MIPYTPGADLQKKMQRAENAYCTATGARKIRVIERGGSKLIDLLGRTDPWLSQRHMW